MKRLLLLLNMGGPRDMSEVELFLKNMFNDPCILGIKNKFLRRFVAFMITRGRLKTAQSNYAKIGGKSPICELSQRLCDKITSLNEAKFDAIAFAMNYTPPFAKDVLARYLGFDEIVVFPLYPHHSVTTVVSSLDDFKKAYDELKMSANVRVVEPFFESKIYNEIIVSDIKSRVSNLDISDIEMIFSAHSLPQKVIKNGDLYESHVNKQVEILKEMLNEAGLNFKNVTLAYQSRLGPVKWLEPSLGDVLANVGSKKALIYPISFCIDNSETIFELVREFRDVADELNFKFYDVVPCMNDGDAFANFILKVAAE